MTTMGAGANQTAVGVVTEVHGPVAVISCQPLPPLHQALRTTPDGEDYLFEVHQHVDDAYVRAIALHRSSEKTLAAPAEQYVFAALHQMLYASLWAENSRRVARLEGAVRHLDDQSAELTRRSHALRQEEIVEEIEVMLLSADAGTLPRNHAASRR
jgi:F0F1-type ATP synthase gamma subunit